MLEALVFFGAPFVAMVVFSGVALLEGDSRLARKLFRRSGYFLSAEFLSAAYFSFAVSYPGGSYWRQLLGPTLSLASFFVFLFADEAIG